MTQPTQAQIFDVIAEWANTKGISLDDTKDLGERLETLAAAAQVGELPYQSEALLHHIEQIKAATIERCARVADNFYAQLPTDNFKEVPISLGKEIAVAIRALKDKP